MFETRLSQQQIESIIKIEKRSNIIVKIFFGIWRLFGFVGILGIVNNSINSTQLTTSNYESFINFLTLVISCFIVAGFFWGIPHFVSRSLKKRENRLRNGDFKVYIGIVRDKYYKYRNKKDYYCVNIIGIDDEIQTNHTNYNMISIGQEVYVLQDDCNLDCYSYEYLNKYIKK